MRDYERLRAIADILPLLPAARRDALDAFIAAHGLDRPDLALSPSQRAAAAARLCEIANVGRRRKNPLLCARQAGAALGVCKQTVFNAIRISRQDPELFERILGGEMSVWFGMVEIGAIRRGKPRPSPKKPPAERQPLIRVVHEGNEALAEQLCALCHRLRELGAKIEPMALLAKFPARLLHNLDMSLRPAALFLAAFDRAHALSSREAAEGSNSAALAGAALDRLSS